MSLKSELVEVEDYTVINENLCAVVRKKCAYQTSVACSPSPLEASSSGLHKLLPEIVARCIAGNVDARFSHERTIRGTKKDNLSSRLTLFAMYKRVQAFVFVTVVQRQPAGFYAEYMLQGHSNNTENT